MESNKGRYVDTYFPTTKTLFNAFYFDCIQTNFLTTRDCILYQSPLFCPSILISHNRRWVYQYFLFEAIQ
jgi:hypothetical protein